MSEDLSTMLRTAPRRDRDALLTAARDAGVGVGLLARSTGLTRGRIYQITGPRR